jgi:hypothetical protein
MAPRGTATPDNPAPGGSAAGDPAERPVGELTGQSEVPAARSAEPCRLRPQALRHDRVPPRRLSGKDPTVRGGRLWHPPGLSQPRNGPRTEEHPWSRSRSASEPAP